MEFFLHPSVVAHASMYLKEAVVVAIFIVAFEKDFSQTILHEYLCSKGSCHFKGHFSFLSGILWQLGSQYMAENLNTKKTCIFVSVIIIILLWEEVLIQVAHQTAAVTEHDKM